MQMCPDGVHLNLIDFYTVDSNGVSKREGKQQEDNVEGKIDALPKGHPHPHMEVGNLCRAADAYASWGSYTYMHSCVRHVAGWSAAHLLDLLFQAGPPRHLHLHVALELVQLMVHAVKASGRASCMLNQHLDLVVVSGQGSGAPAQAPQHGQTVRT